MATTGLSDTNGSYLAKDGLIGPQYKIDYVRVQDLTSPDFSDCDGAVMVSTGIGFLDHMIDQFHSHAQISVSILVTNEVSSTGQDDKRKIHESEMGLDNEGIVTFGRNNGCDDSHTDDLHPLKRFKQTSLENEKNRHASRMDNQKSLLELVGRAIGTELRKLLIDASISPCPQSSSTIIPTRFSCPLDEALTTCEITVHRTDGSSDSIPVQGGISECNIQSHQNTHLQENMKQEHKEQNDIHHPKCVYDLAPYGKYHRTFVGQLEVDALPNFWYELVSCSGIESMKLQKLRGENAHHIIESSFKAFCRCLRNVLDDSHSYKNNNICSVSNSKSVTQDNLSPYMYRAGSLNWEATIELNRSCAIHRRTKETSIDVQLDWDGGKRGVHVSTGVEMLDLFFTRLVSATSSLLSLTVSCTGDLHIDEHHTAEDVSIAIGQAVNESLGSKAGLNRMWTYRVHIGEDDNWDNDSSDHHSNHSNYNEYVEVTMDLSNRPQLTSNLNLLQEQKNTVNGTKQVNGMSLPSHAYCEKVQDLSLEMFEHVLESLVINARMTVHIFHFQNHEKTNITNVESLKSIILATATAFGRCLKYCAMVDTRRAGTTASSKGTLSV